MQAGFVGTIHAELERLQRGAADRCVALRAVPIGLGGQITGRVNMLLVALALGRTAVFPRDDDPPYGQVFDPLGDHRLAPRTIDAAPLLDLARDQADAVVVLDPLHVNIPQRHAQLRAMIARRLGVDAPDMLAIEGAILGWMRPTARMRAFADAAAARLGIDRDTIGVHFRRGDKKTETAFVPAAEFNRRIAALHARRPFATLFLASDSPAARDSIVAPPGVRLIFDTQEQRYDNANHKMLIGSPELVAQETEVAYKNIALLARCGGLVGQDNAHFATLAAATIVARDGPHASIALIDGKVAQRGSALLRLRFRLWLAARAIGRRLAPWATTAARLKRIETARAR